MKQTKKMAGYMLTELALSLTIIGSLMFAVSKAAVPVIEQANAIIKQYEQIPANLAQMGTPSERLAHLKAQAEKASLEPVPLNSEQQAAVAEVESKATQMLEQSKTISAGN